MSVYRDQQPRIVPNRDRTTCLFCNSRPSLGAMLLDDMDSLLSRPLPSAAMGGGARYGSAESSLRVVEAAPGLFYATYANLIFAIENTEPSVGYIDALRNFIPQMTRNLGCGVGLMVVIRADAKPPSEEVREHIKLAGKTFAPHVLAFAHVVEGEGFLAAAKRAAFTLLMSSARLGFPVKVFRNVAEGMPWLVRGVGKTFKEDMKRDELVRLVEEFRRSQFEKASRRAL